MHTKDLLIYVMPIIYNMASYSCFRSHRSVYWWSKPGEKSKIYTELTGASQTKWSLNVMWWCPVANYIQV